MNQIIIDVMNEAPAELKVSAENGLKIYKDLIINEPPSKRFPKLTYRDFSIPNNEKISSTSWHNGKYIIEYNNKKIFETDCIEKLKVAGSFLEF